MKLEFNKEELLNLLINCSDKDLNEVIEDIHPADILDIIHEDEDHLFSILNRLPEWMIADIIDQEDDEEKYEILKRFSENRQKRIIEEMSSDEITDLVGILDEEESKAFLGKMTDEDREEVCQLLSYEPDTAGGIMATEFISIRENKSIIETLKYLQKEAPDAESSYYLYVVDSEDILKGVVSLRDIACSSFDTKISDITNTKVISVQV